MWSFASCVHLLFNFITVLTRPDSVSYPQEQHIPSIFPPIISNYC
eukprot:UN05005